MGGGILFRYVTTVRPGRGYLIYVCYFRTVEWPTYGWLANLHVARSVDWSCGHAPLNVTNLDLIMWHGRCLSCTTTNNNWKACLREFFFFFSPEKYCDRYNDPNKYKVTITSSKKKKAFQAGFPFVCTCGSNATCTNRLLVSSALLSIHQFSRCSGPTSFGAVIRPSTNLVWKSSFVIKTLLFGFSSRISRRDRVGFSVGGGGHQFKPFD